MVQAFVQSEDDKWDGWDQRAIDYLEQQEEFSERYEEEHSYSCARLYYGYDQGDSMYPSDGTPLPKDYE